MSADQAQLSNSFSSLHSSSHTLHSLKWAIITSRQSYITSFSVEMIQVLRPEQEEVPEKHSLNRTVEKYCNNRCRECKDSSDDGKWKRKREREDEVIIWREELFKNETLNGSRLNSHQVLMLVPQFSLFLSLPSLTLHFLSLTHRPSHTYLCLSEPTDLQLPFISCLASLIPFLHANGKAGIDRGRRATK